MDVNSNIKWGTFCAFFPITGLIASIKFNKTKVYPVIFCLFFFFIGSQTIVNDMNDVGRDIITFSNLSENKNISFWSYFYSMQESNQIDYYKPFMSWFISRFTSNPKLYSGLIAMITGLILSFNIAYIGKRIKNFKICIFLLFVLFLIPNPSYYTHRWWMAMQVFLLGALPYVLDGNKKCLLVSSLSLLVHFSFLYPLVLLLFLKAVPSNKLLPYVLIFILANSVDALDLNRIAEGLTQYLPDSFNERNEMYINAEFQEHNWFSQSARLCWKWLNMLLVILIYHRSKNIMDQRKELRKMYILALLIGSFSAISNTTEWGWRYLDLSNFLFCSLYILLANKSMFSLNKNGVLIQLLFPFFLYTILFQIRGIFSVIGLNAFLYGNVFTTWFVEDSLSILDMIKL